MDKFIIKTIVVLSLILGAILGLLAPIPFVGMVMLFAALLLAAPLVVIYLIILKTLILLINLKWLEMFAMMML